MDKTQALQNLLNGTATEEEINLLKGGLASGEISIGGNINQSVIIIGSGNTVELPPAALDRLGGRSLLGDLDRDLTGDEIAAGLNRLEVELPRRAPILLTQLQEHTRRLRPTLKTNLKSLSDQARRERVEALAQVNSLCMEALDVSFNALCLGEEPPEYDSRSPFRGLESFRPEDSEFFFGREALTKKLVAKIQSHPFLAVLGASGSGKSSLVMAGLIPALGSEYIIFRPGTSPLEELEAVKENTLVVLDQFEELFTLTRDEGTRKEFIAKLLETTKRNKVILTLRSDFLGEVGAYRSLKEEIQSHLEIVPPMDMDELRRAMEGQAGVVGLRFEAYLSQQILDDVEGEPGAMPLLQHSLWELWNRRHGRNLRASEYRAFGRVKQAITSTAEKVYGECTKTEQEQVRDIFLRLTRLDEGDEGRDTRRRVPLNDLIPSGTDSASISAVLDKLANARLIVKTANEELTEIEVAHEALIRHWERLRIWLNEDRDNLRLRESVSEDARKWENAERDEALLNHRGWRLELVIAISKEQRYQLNSTERTYIDECVKLMKREKAEKQAQELSKMKEDYLQRKDNFIQSNGQELKNPLTIIKDRSQLLASQFKDNPKQLCFINDILDSADRMAEITGNIQDFSLTETIKIKSEYTDIGTIITLVHKAFTGALKENKITLVVERLDSLPKFYGDPDLLYRVFYHLLMNAIKYTPKHGRIKISGRLVEEFSRASQIEVAIKDSGVGIDHRDIERIFEKYYSTGDGLHKSTEMKNKSGGLGMGLAIARNIVNWHRGTISVESFGYDDKKCTGSTFFVRLPVNN